MTATLISLLSILMGIVGANLFGVFYKKYSFGLVGNTIAGVFGAIFTIKSFGRLGFNPHFILETTTVNYGLLALNLLLSFVSGAVGLLLIAKLNQKFNPKKEN
ncbi:hypothetical protein DNU06_15470 [Putridiphycobacter roseus]|uniref:Uncharacterized protein n=1 Tax=Putridiphycobacter roseus TaxID=2219161 RepID=A0A2W1NCV4_9FLAO|nr:hypothetical protein [Putridiphycobacter roseus]PZE15906.1 hypothetical protein DNU06_15470 [Putridiphycobacter roseus]